MNERRNEERVARRANVIIESSDDEVREFDGDVLEERESANEENHEEANRQKEISNDEVRDKVLDFDGDVLEESESANEENHEDANRQQEISDDGDVLEERESGNEENHEDANRQQEISDDEEMCTENEDTDDEHEADTMDVNATDVPATVVEHHSAACIGDVDRSMGCELYYIDIVLDWTGECIAKRVDFIYLGVKSSGFGDLHKCGSVTCGACIVAQNSEKVETWDELVVSTPWARTARALLLLLHDKFGRRDSTSFMRDCVGLESTDVNHLLTAHALKILPATTLAAKPILEAIQSIFRSQLSNLPQARGRLP